MLPIFIWLHFNQLFLSQLVSVVFEYTKVSSPNIHKSTSNLCRFPMLLLSNCNKIYYYIITIISFAKLLGSITHKERCTLWPFINHQINYNTIFWIVTTFYRKSIEKDEAKKKAKKKTNYNQNEKEIIHFKIQCLNNNLYYNIEHSVLFHIINVCKT
jgi:hypothetical protein